MGLFSLMTNPNHRTQTAVSLPLSERRRVREATGGGGGGGGGLSIVAKDLTITGDLEAGGVIRIEGRILGNVQAGEQVLLSEGGIIEGNVTAREAVIGGCVRGSITGDERVELQAQAVVQGDIATRRLLIQEGGRVNGTVVMESVGSDE